MKELERPLKAMANRRRLAILRFLKQRRKATVRDISEAIKLSFTATSKHLGKLAAADIVEREQIGLNMLYHLSPDMPAAAKSLLTHL